MPFGYKGCGGNGNRFISKRQCLKKCPRPKDFTYFHLHCDLGKRNVKPILCESIPGIRRHYPISVCPSGYKCKGGLFLIYVVILQINKYMIKIQAINQNVKMAKIRLNIMAGLVKMNFVLKRRNVFN
nr:unnamed protein product [Meloidogyne enterolobii]